MVIEMVMVMLYVDKYWIFSDFIGDFIGIIPRNALSF